MAKQKSRSQRAPSWHPFSLRPTRNYFMCTSSTVDPFLLCRENSVPQDNPQKWKDTVRRCMNWWAWWACSSRVWYVFFFFSCMNTVVCLVSSYGSWDIRSSQCHLTILSPCTSCLHGWSLLWITCFTTLGGNRISRPIHSCKCNAIL